MKKLVLITGLFLLINSINRVFGQLPQTITPATDTVKLVDILHADRLRFLKPDSLNELMIAAGNVAFKDRNTLFYADSVIHNKQLNVIEAFGNVHINDADSVHTY